MKILIKQITISMNIYVIKAILTVPEQEGWDRQAEGYMELWHCVWITGVCQLIRKDNRGKK